MSQYYIWYLMMFDLSELCCAMTTHNVLCAIPLDQPGPLYCIWASHVPIVMEVMVPPSRPPHLQSNQRAGGGGFRDWMHKMSDWFISFLWPGDHLWYVKNVCQLSDLCTKWKSSVRNEISEEIPKINITPSVPRSTKRTEKINYTPIICWYGPNL